MIASKELFRGELECMEDAELKSYLIDIIDNYVLPCNYIKPSSGSGKYHPKEDNLPYGNTTHTKNVFKIAYELIDTRDDLRKWRDCLLSSCILHDLCKYDSAKSVHTNKEHNNSISLLIKRYIREKHLEENESLFNKFNLISKLVYLHMGKYTKGENFYEQIAMLSLQERELAYILHYSDYLASRRWFKINEV